MKRLLYIGLFAMLVCVSTDARAQYLCAGQQSIPVGGGHVGIFADPSGQGWCLVGTVPFETYTIYVVHVLAVEANTVQFKVVTTWTGPTPTVAYNGLKLGEIFSGVVVTYGGCKPLPYVVATITLYATAPIPACTQFRVVPDPYATSGEVEAIDCDANRRTATGGWFFVNAFDCSDVCTGPVCEEPVGTDQTTWGRVKSLYR